MSASVDTTEFLDSVQLSERAPRTYQNYPGSNYVLPSDEQERQRLALQHKVLTKAFEDKLVLAPLDLGQAHFVLDSGTGAAVWLSELAQRISPSAVLLGVDIESRLFPQYPAKNMSFSVNSITHLPSEWTERFDLVHQRLLIAALQKAEWPVALAEMFRVLRPGGWIQLGEAGRVVAGEKNERLRELIDKLLSSRGLILDISVDLPELVSQAGFSNLVVEERVIPLGSWAGQDGTDAGNNFMGVFRGMKTPILRSGGFGMVDSESALDQLLDDVRSEWDTQRGSQVTFHIVYAQKSTIPRGPPTATRPSYQFAVLAPYRTDEDSSQRRALARPAHMRANKAYVEKGMIKGGGVTVSPDSVNSVDPKLNGSLLIYQVSSTEAVRNIIEADVYWTDNVWDKEKIEIKPFIVASV